MVPLVGWGFCLWMWLVILFKCQGLCIDYVSSSLSSGGPLEQSRAPGFREPLGWPQVGWQNGWKLIYCLVYPPWVSKLLPFRDHHGRARALPGHNSTTSPNVCCSFVYFVLFVFAAICFAFYFNLLPLGEHRQVLGLHLCNSLLSGNLAVLNSSFCLQSFEMTEPRWLPCF